MSAQGYDFFIIGFLLILGISFAYLPGQMPFIQNFVGFASEELANFTFSLTEEEYSILLNVTLTKTDPANDRQALEMIQNRSEALAEKIIKLNNDIMNRISAIKSSEAKNYLESLIRATIALNNAYNSTESDWSAMLNRSDTMVQRFRHLSLSAQLELIGKFPELSSYDNSNATFPEL